MTTEDLQRSAEVVTTANGDGRMVWHLWGAGPPLVLLHGGSGSWTHWIRNIEGLSRHFRLLVADMPGLGESDDPPEPFNTRDFPASVDRLASGILSGIDEILGVGTAFHLAGFSFGSINGAYLAASAGARVRTFTLVGSAAFGWPWDGLSGTFKSMTDDMDDAQCLDVQRHNLSLTMLAGPVDDAVSRLQLENVRRARVRSHGVAATDTLVRALPRVVAPINGIWGRADVFAQPNLDRIGDLLRDCDPDAIYEIIDHAGHWVMYEQPDTFNACLIHIIEQRSPK